MSHNDKDALPPSYTDSVSHQQPCPSSRIHTSSPSRSQSLLTHVSQTRTTHINSTITHDILPLLETQASFGIAQTTIVMLPSDTPSPAAVQEKSEFSFDTDSDTTKAIEEISFPSDADQKVVRLKGQMNRVEFWRARDVLAELEDTLYRRVNERAVLGRSPMCAGSVEQGRNQTRKEKQKRSMLSRIVASLGAEQRSVNGDSEGGDGSSVGVVLVKVRLEEICLRTVSEFGLYDSVSKQGVVVRVDARC